MLKQIRRILTLRCDDHLDVVHRGLDRPTGWTDRMAAWGHWFACGPCRKAVREILNIEQAIRSIGNPPPVKLSEEARKRMAEAIDQASKMSPRPRELDSEQESPSGREPPPA